MTGVRVRVKGKRGVTVLPSRVEADFARVFAPAPADKPATGRGVSKLTPEKLLAKIERAAAMRQFDDVLRLEAKFKKMFGAL